jgi:hypothetical protein
MGMLTLDNTIIRTRHAKGSLFLAGLFISPIFLAAEANACAFVRLSNVQPMAESMAQVSCGVSTVAAQLRLALEYVGFTQLTSTYKRTALLCAGRSNVSINPLLDLGDFNSLLSVAVVNICAQTFKTSVDLWFQT